MILSTLLRSIINRKTLIRNAIFMLLIVTASLFTFPEYLHSVNPRPVMLLLFFFFNSLSSIFISRSLFRFENFKSIVVLPLNSNKVFLSVILTLSIVTFIQTGVYFIILAVVLWTNKLYWILLFVVLTLLSNVFILLLIINHNRGKFTINIVNLISFLLIIFLILKYFSSYINIFLLIVFLTVIIYYIQFQYNCTDLILNDTHTVNSFFSKNTHTNYYYGVFMQEKMTIFNGAFLIVFSLILATTSKGNPILFILMWSIGSINSPVLTMISSDKRTQLHSKMFPASNSSLYKMYLNFLIYYFLLVNSIFTVYSLIVIKSGLFMTLIIAILSYLIEVCGSYYFERNFPINNWKNKDELNKKPRKYIIAFCLFLLNSIVYSLLS